MKVTTDKTVDKALATQFKQDFWNEFVWNKIGPLKRRVFGRIKTSKTYVDAYEIRATFSLPNGLKVMVFDVVNKGEAKNRQLLFVKASALAKKLSVNLGEAAIENLLEGMK
jgi:hypothetical protein